jgi:hypothetical protein
MHVVHCQAGTGMMCSRKSGTSPARDLAAYLTDDSRLSTVILERLLRAELSRGVKARMYFRVRQVHDQHQGSRTVEDLNTISLSDPIYDVDMGLPSSRTE